MANFSVMADVPNPVFDSNGNPFSGAVLKAYLPGTTTSTSIAIDENGGSPQASITYNAAGKLEVSGNEILPYIDIKHKWGIFANAADAAANTPFYMGSFDDVPVLNATLIKDLSQAYDFTSILAMVDSLIIFPLGKTLTVSSIAAEYTVTTGASPHVGSPAIAGGQYASLIVTFETTINQFGAVADSDGTAGVGQDNQPHCQAMLDQGIPLQVGIGRYRIAAPLDRPNATYIGKRSRRTSADLASELVCDTTASLGPFIAMPHLVKGLLISGTGQVAGSVGVSMDNVTPGFFHAESKLEDVRIKIFDLSLHTGNVFVMGIKKVILEDSNKGWDVKPPNLAGVNGGDNGYFSTIYVDNLAIRTCTEYAYDISPDLKSPNLSLKNFNVENNGDTGTFQGRMRNCDPFVWDNCYWENAPSIPAFLNAGGNVGSATAMYLNNTGGIDLVTGTFGCDFERVKQIGGVIIANGGANQTLKFSNSALLFDGATVPSLKNLTMINTEADGTLYNHYEVGSGVDFNFNTSAKMKSIIPIQFTVVSEIIVAANSAATIASNVALTNIMEKATAVASFRDLYNNKVQLVVTTATTNSNDFYSIIGHNNFGSSFTIPASTIIDIMFFKHNEA